ncbi:acyltransferase family protein [Pseudomonas cucumis]|uniref:acyltransferase family protein n=1 Tax=Pseudomonas cucumis TaxID=2954082 RepID=UPI0027341B07|nr:acyltransferase [Pseudomonas cucumis]WLG88966.1 acyltransferase [Pseudomonas cucumis]
MTTEILTQRRSLHFPLIDVLRGFAAISVVIYHIIEHFSWTTFPATGMLTWFRIGWMGVDLFFVISGLVIGLAAFSGIDKYGAQGFRSDFIRRRITRIVPLHYLTILVFIAFIMPELMFQGFWTNLFTHLFFVHNLFPSFHGAINGSNWSLGTEMQFYVLMVAISPWLYVTRIWKVLLAFLMAAWAWRLGTTLLIQPDALGPFRIFLVSTQLPGMLDEFAIGIVMAKLFRSEIGHRIIAFCQRTPMAIGVCVVAAAVFYLMLSIYWRYASFWDIPMMVVFFRTFIALSFGLIIFAACMITPGEKAKRLLFPFTYLGEISFGIYLWHLPVLLSLKRLTWLSHEQIVVVALLLTIMLASVSWHFFEQPLMKKYSSSHKKAPIEGHATQVENATA